MIFVLIRLPWHVPPVGWHLVVRACRGLLRVATIATAVAVRWNLSLVGVDLRPHV
jgi:hypothetical protein